MSVLQRRVRFTAKPRSIRERELEAHYLHLIREEKAKYQKLANYNTRLYSSYTGFFNHVSAAINDAEDDEVVKKEAREVLQEKMMPPFHPLK